MTLLKPKPGLCQECAVKHEPEAPHDATSLYWQMNRKMAGKPANWRAAMAHCSPEVQAAWTEKLTQMFGIDVDGEKVRP
jgi:hypothetical protein